ncbi:MAG: terminase family protein [Firmicutes bacterium]|nr:terminase family protein [Bacillota bacterium]
MKKIKEKAKKMSLKTKQQSSCVLKNQISIDELERLSKIDKIKERIKKIEIKQQQNRKKNKIFEYNNPKFNDKIHFKQLQFHKCLKRNRWIFGGNRSGKTECGAVEAVWSLRGIHPYRQNKDGVTGWVVSPSFSVSREVAQAKILHYLNPDWIDEIVMHEGRSSSPKTGIIDFVSIKNVFGGTSKICFKSSDQSREKFQGASLDFVWFDEEPPLDIYDECKMRVLDKKGDIFGTMTPLMGKSFVYDTIFLNSNADEQVWHICMEWADNPFLDKGEIEAFSTSFSDEVLQSRRFGKFSGDKGLVYSEFDERVNVIKPFIVPRDWYDNLSIDPGLNNPLSCHWYATDGDGNVYVVAEHYQRGKGVDWHARRILEISDCLGWHRDSFGRVGALIDSAASQRTLAAEKSVVELFAECGIQTNPKVDKNLFAGIARVKRYFGGGRVGVNSDRVDSDKVNSDRVDSDKVNSDRVDEGDGAASERVNSECGGDSKNLFPQIYIFDTCVNLIRELKGYWWGEGDVPKKKDDHALDELRYYIMSRPEPFLQSKRKSIIEKDKERLYKKLKSDRNGLYSKG